MVNPFGKQRISPQHTNFVNPLYYITTASRLMADVVTELALVEYLREGGILQSLPSNRLLFLCYTGGGAL